MGKAGHVGPARTAGLPDAAEWLAGGGRGGKRRGSGYNLPREKGNLGHLRILKSKV